MASCGAWASSSLTTERRIGQLLQVVQDQQQVSLTRGARRRSAALGPRPAMPRFSAIVLHMTSAVLAVASGHEVDTVGARRSEAASRGDRQSRLA